MPEEHQEEQNEEKQCPASNSNVSRFFQCRGDFAPFLLIDDFEDEGEELKELLADFLSAQNINPKDLLVAAEEPEWEIIQVSNSAPFDKELVDFKKTLAHLGFEWNQVITTLKTLPGLDKEDEISEENTSDASEPEDDYELVETPSDISPNGFKKCGPFYKLELCFRRFFDIKKIDISTVLTSDQTGKGDIYLGPAPRAETLKNFREKNSCKLVIFSLLEDKEYDALGNCYVENVFGEYRLKEEFSALKFELIRCPIADHFDNGFQPQTLDAKLDQLVKKRNDGYDILFHCKAGVGRSRVATSSFILKSKIEEEQSKDNNIQTIIVSETLGQIEAAVTISRPASSLKDKRTIHFLSYANHLLKEKDQPELDIRSEKITQKAKKIVEQSKKEGKTKPTTGPTLKR